MSGRKRGLLDFFLTCVTCAGVYTQTPVGALIDRGLEFVFDLDRPHRELTSFFDVERSDGPSDAELNTLASARKQMPKETLDAAKQAGVATELYRALELAFGDEREDIAAVARDVANRQERHGHLDAALEAFVLGDDVVGRAIERARGRGIASPWRASQHRRYLTRAQRERAEPVVNRVMSIYTALTFQWPVLIPHRISSPFGYRGDPFLGTRRFHNGVDLAIKTGTEIMAAQDGEVERSTYDGVNGYYVQLSHGYGVKTAYCHNSRNLLERGASATRGQPIALSGSTGRSTGPHLHYIVKIGGRAVDPLRFGGPPESARKKPRR